MARRAMLLSVTLLLVLEAISSISMSGSQAVQAQAGCQEFNAVPYVVCGPFLTYWQTHGGLAQQGYPISTPMVEVSDTDGNSYDVQYFERAVFELHGSQVLLSLLGSFQYGEKYSNGAPGQQANTSSGTMLFSQTGKHLGGSFLQYWQQHGGVQQQGYPISEEFTEKSDTDNKTYTVQYFQRAVFEYHPDNPTASRVLLSLLGNARYGQKHSGGSNIVGSSNASLSPPDTRQMPGPPLVTPVPTPAPPPTDQYLAGVWDCTTFWSSTQGNLNCSPLRLIISWIGGAYEYTLYNSDTQEAVARGYASQKSNQASFSDKLGAWGPGTLVNTQQLRFVFASAVDGSDVRMVFQRR